MTIKVSIAGATGTAELTGDTIQSVREVLEQAATDLGFQDINLSTLTPVVNGEDAELDDAVPDGAVVNAAPAVANGA